jgi:HAD superfamily hydrolase (TIGR01662 family)
MRPKGVLIDCGGTLINEPSFNPRRGNEWLLTRADCNPMQITIDRIMERAAIIDREVVARRDDCHLETPWRMLTKLIYDFFGIQFACDIADLELGYWKASEETQPMPEAIEALNELHRNDIPVGVVSNSIFGSAIIQHGLAKHGLAEHLQFVITSAEYSVRKPSPLLFDIAAAKLARKPEDIWFIGDRLDIDVYGANAAGMTPVWFQPSKGSSLSCLSVADWSEFLFRLRNP